MNLCIPVTEDKGLQSPVSGHFGSAPLFAIVNPDMGVCRTISNRDSHHSHGACQPLASLAGEGVDAVVVGGIGAGALSKLQAAGISVFLSEQPTVEAVVAAFKTGTLQLATPEGACAHHRHSQCCEETA
jgi:predicted Fe-Mo cluster-binding NifX family protein